MFKVIAMLAAAAWWLLQQIGIKPGKPRPVDVSGTLFMPLFLRILGKLCSTWDFLARPYTEQCAIRAEIKRLAVKGETPAIVFLLTTREGGSLWARFPDLLNDLAVDAAVSAMEECVRDGIAVIPCLYVDDPSGSMPRWWEIASHAHGLVALHARIGHLVSGYIVSIEQNERARDRGQIEATIDTLRRAMPGAQVYGTHLQHRGGGAGYSWRVAVDTPRNADIIVAEASWNPDAGDRVGVAGVRQEADMMGAAGFDRRRVVFQEYNLNPGGNVEAAQRAHLRGRGFRGVG